jgi:hypothetical protein
MVATATDAFTEEDAKSAAESYETSVKLNSSSSGLIEINSRRLFRERGLTKLSRDKNGGIVENLDLDAIRDRVLDQVDQHDLVVDKNTHDGSADRDEVTGAVIDGMATPDDENAWDALDGAERDAWEAARTKVWKAFDMNPGGPLQRTIAEREDGTMLVKTKTLVYLTAEEKYIRQDAVRPELDKIGRLAGATGEKIGLWAKQVPALKAPANRELSKAMKTAQDKAEGAFKFRAPADANGNGE